MKTKDIIFLILTIIVLFLVLNITSFAAENDIVDSALESSGANELFDSLDDETKQALSTVGIDELNLEEIYSVSPKRIITLIIEIFKGRFTEPLKLFFLLVIILFFESVTEGILNTNKDDFRSIIFTLLICSVTVVHIIECISLACSNLLLTSDFMIAFIPVYVFLLSSSGRITQALNFNTLIFGLGELIINLSKSILLPIMSVFVSINIACCVNPVMPIKSVAESIKKVITLCLTLISTVFVGILSVKGNIASSIDAVTLRSIKTLSGAAIPIIGSSMGDAYASIAGSMGLISNSVGFLGILIIAVINLPVIIELFLWYMCLNLSSIVGEALGSSSAKLLKSLSGAVSVINIILVLTSAVFIISTGIVIKAGN